MDTYFHNYNLCCRTSGYDQDLEDFLNDSGGASSSGSGNSSSRERDGESYSTGGPTVDKYGLLCAQSFVIIILFCVQEQVCWFR